MGLLSVRSTRNILPFGASCDPSTTVEVTIGGHAYTLEAWDESQWAGMPEASRPRAAFRLGRQWVELRPARPG